MPPDYFAGLVSERYNPVKNRFEKMRGAARNEPLDTWVYAYVAAHHPELRLHRRSKADWDAAEARLRPAATDADAVPRGTSAADGAVEAVPAPAPRRNFAKNW